MKSSFSNLKKKFLLWEILNTYKSKENNTMNPPIPITPLQQNAWPILFPLIFSCTFPSQIILKQIHDILSFHLYIISFSLYLGKVKAQFKKIKHMHTVCEI